MAERYLFLDFDGVINALNPRVAREEWGAIESTHLRGFTITYAPAVVAAVEALSAAGVHVVWLTTWCEHTSEFPPLGFSEYPYIGAEARVDNNIGDWWKWAALREYVKGLPDDALIGWCDDDLSYSMRLQPEIAELLAPDRVLGISPHYWPGLTRDQIASLFKHFGVGCTGDECGDDCTPCGLPDASLWCDDCRAYAASDADAVTHG